MDIFWRFKLKFVEVFYAFSRVNHYKFSAPAVAIVGYKNLPTVEILPI